MSQTAAFYVNQAASCEKAAAEASLANEREKFRQAQAAWQALADATIRTSEESAKRDAERKAAALAVSLG
jgi:hypothetical protein